MPATGALPNLLIIGAAKCGTTSLHRYLDQHPDISMAGGDGLSAKELRFFTDPDWRDELDRYARHFSAEVAVGRFGRGLPTPVRRAVGRPMRRALSRSIETPVIDDRLRAKLTAILQDEADRFRELAGRDFPHWAL